METIWWSVDIQLISESHLSKLPACYSDIYILSRYDNVWSLLLNINNLWGRFSIIYMYWRCNVFLRSLSASITFHYLIALKRGQ